MPQRAAELGLSAARLAQASLSDRQVARMGFTALRCACPTLLDVLSLRASEGRLLRADVEEHLDAWGAWPNGTLEDPVPALALTIQWAVGGEQVRRPERALAAFAEILRRHGSEAFSLVDRSAQLFVQTAWFQGDLASVGDLIGRLPLSRESVADLQTDVANPFARHLDPTPVALASWLGLFNRRFRDAGVAPVSLASHAGTPFDRLTAPVAAPVDGPLVSVIVPSYAPDDGLLNSIRSMGAQSYGNLEILLVDDASGPSYTRLYEEAEALDARVRVVRMAENGGSYLGRNAALARAKGLFITTQDADDWSHPERMARQVALLREHPMAPASRSDAIRALDDLSLQWLGYDSQRPNASSLMVRREAFETVGGFDTVRKGADSELHERLERRLGPTLHTTTPLAITRLRAGSLSRSDFRLHWMAPDRVLYRASFRGFHKHGMPPGHPPLLPAAQLRRRSFPAPRSYQRDVPDARPLPTSYDIVYLADLSLPGPLSARGRMSLLPKRLRVAVIHQEHPGAGPRNRPNDFTSALGLAIDGRVDMISATDPVDADTVVVLTPGLLEFPSLDTPTVRARHTAVALSSTTGEPADLLAARAGARAVVAGADIEFVGLTQDDAREWGELSGEPTRTLVDLVSAIHPSTRRTRRPGAERAQQPAPSAGSSAIVVLGDDILDVQYAVALWAEHHPDDSAVIVHTGQRVGQLPSNVRPVSVRGSGLLDGEMGGPTSRRLLNALSRHAAVIREVDRASLVVVPDSVVADVTARHSRPGLEVRAFSRFVLDARAQHALRLVDTVGTGPGRGPAATTTLAEVLSTGDPSPELTSAAAQAVSRLLRARDNEAVSALAPVVAQLPASTREQHGLDAMVRSAQISLGSPSLPTDARAAAVCFESAEASTRSGRVDDVPLLVSAGLRLLFNRELHTDGEHALLIDDPIGHLAPWRDSAFAARLARAVAARHDVDEGPGADAGAEPVVVLGGVYGDFAGPVLDLLTAVGVDTQLVRTAELGGFFGRQQVDEALATEWLRLVDPDTFGGLARDPVLERQLAEFAALISTAGTIFADWCDPGAAFASLLKPPGTRLVVRIHRLDAVRVWHQVIDWRAVSVLIVVSDHVKTIVERQITAPGAAPPTRIEVLQNVIDVARYRRPKRQGAHRRLAMVGWGRQIKDPLFALDILQELLADDPDWTLHLIGRDFGPEGSPPMQQYARRFREHASSAALREHIRYVGFTSRLEEALDDCGFALSTSRAEGWPVGIIESAASGAIPVIRDWPQVAALGGARQVYADHLDWVVASAAEAAVRIRAYCEPQTWAAESARVRAAADTLCAVGATSDHYLDVILGRAASSPPGRGADPAPR